MTDLSTGDGQLLDNADTLLATTTSLLDRAFSALKATCSEDGKVAAAKLDAHQLVSYDLSLSWAECTAARFALQHARRLGETGGDDLVTELIHAEDDGDRL